ncbi:recombinase family protein [Streptomyces mutomycini]|uniref:recombinase family protein n=1 Tax=Streptomyces mutomycini TaxID=284036 RepID=UPI003F4D520A
MADTQHTADSRPSVANQLELRASTRGSSSEVSGAPASTPTGSAPTAGTSGCSALDALNAVGCRRIFADKKSGKNDLRPELKACHAFLAPGDTLVVPPSTATAARCRT